MKNVVFIGLSAFILCNTIVAQTFNSGAIESTPSYSQYFSWINNTNEGATTAQTLVNFRFSDDFGEWREIESYVLGFDSQHTELSPEVYISAYPVPYRKKNCKTLQEENRLIANSAYNCTIDKDVI